MKDEPAKKKDLDEHILVDKVFHTEIGYDIKNIKENHLAHIQTAIEQIQNNLGWIFKIFVFAAPLAIGAFTYSFYWEMVTSNQVAGVLQAVQDLKSK